MNGEKTSFIPVDLGIAFQKQAWYTSIAYTTFFIFGIMRGYPDFLLNQLSLKSSDSIIYVTSPEEKSWIASLSIFSNPFGSILAGVLMDKFGRKLTLQLSMLIFTVGWAVVTCSYTLIILCTGNVIVGIAIGMGACSTIYVAEICEVRNRCMLLSFLEIYFSLGILVAYVSTCYLKWNYAALIFTLFSSFSLCMLYYIPESPYWLLKKNELHKAMASFKKLRDENKKQEYEKEFDDIIRSIRNEQHGPNDFSNAIRNNFKAFVILILFHVLLQGTGYTIVLTYLSTFLHGFNIPYDANYIKIGYSFSSFVASFATPLSMYYWKRKEVTVLSGIGMSISMIILALYKSYYYFVNVNIFWVAVPLGFYLYMFSCTVGVLTLSQAMIGELYPTNVRGIMCGLTEAIGTLLSGVSVKIYPTVEQYADKAYILYFFAVFGILTVFFGKFILPETYGKSLSEIQEKYFNKKPAEINDTESKIKY